jgi:spermidine/putrescine-binding protein
MFASALTVGTPYFAAAQEKKAFDGVTLRINGYGGDYSRILQEYVAKPLFEKTGLKVEYQNSTVAAAVAKVIASRDNPPFDIIMVDSPNVPELTKSGLIEEVTRDEVPNISKLLPGVREFGNYGVPFLTNATVVLYNSKQIKEPIKSYADLARADLKDRVGLLSPDNTCGLLAMIALAEANGGSPDNMEPAFKALAGMKKNIASVTSATVNLMQMYEQEEVWAGIMWDGRVYSMRSKGHPIETVAPEEGVYALFNYLAPVKGTKNRKAVLAYINQALSDEAVGALVNFFRYAPCTDIKLSDEVAKDVVVYGKNQAKRKSVDWEKVSGIRGQIIEEFNKAMR